ncbi:MAG: ABC transporter substrate-binding protein, partial [Acetobacteraceae bacterium]|nr:ABC transporter substrate-binding protein [Acetobacteraceae bacterium]
MIRRSFVAAACVGALLCGPARAADKPSELPIGIATFLSGSASVFGIPAKAAADILIDQMNASGGIGGVKVRAIYLDEGAGGEQFLADYRRTVQSEKPGAMLAGISSGDCEKVAPLAEDLKVINLMWDCGTQRVLEETKYRYVFRPIGNGSAEMLATVLYLLKQHPDFKTLAVINQDYAWGHDSWDLFRTALLTLKPDTQVVAELFPKFGASDFSTEISRLSSLHPDVILSTAWGGDLDTIVRQAAQRGLLRRSAFVLALGESSLERLGKTLPEGVLVGARGDAYFLSPSATDPAHAAFLKTFRDKTGQYPIYSVYHMAEALAALKAGYEKAIADNNGAWPDSGALANALSGLKFRAFTGEITIRPEDHQGLQDQLLGTTATSSAYPFDTLDKMMLFPGATVTTPAGQISVQWLKTIT